MLAEGFSSIVNNLNLSAQAFFNTHAQILANMSKSVQQTQANVVGTMNKMLGSLPNPAQQMQGIQAPNPLMPLEQLAKGAGFQPSTDFFKEETPKATHDKVQAKGDYHPLPAGPSHDAPFPAEKKETKPTPMF